MCSYTWKTTRTSGAQATAASASSYLQCWAEQGAMAILEIQRFRINPASEVPVEEWAWRQAPRRGEIVLQWGVSFSEDADYSAIADRSASLPIPPNLTARQRSAGAAP